MPARLDLMERLHRLAVVRKVDALGEHLHRAKLIEVEHEFFVRSGEAAFEPARGMQHEIGARQHRRQKRLRAFVSRLRVGTFEAHSEPPVRNGMFIRRAS